ncbi:MAG: hypothetical protein M3Z14_08070 [Candidatus Eremiobacteraeota bacterium]|nr:hypothetical protein [Candidatus Eremiobacteraeota bacterium]
MKTAVAFFCMFALCCVAIARSADSSVPTELRRAAQVAVRDHKGIIAFQTTWDSIAHGGPMRRAYRYKDAYVFQDERLIKARALAKGDNGTEANQEQLDAETRKIETEQGSGKVFAVPFDSRHFSEYAYAKDTCEQCASGDVKLTFSSPIKDQFHGNGSLIVNATDHVKLLIYSPNVLPKHASTGVITTYRAEVLPGYWATVRSEQRFTGHLGPFSGGAEVSSRSDHYHRYKSIAAALTALHSGNL